MIKKKQFPYFQIGSAIVWSALSFASPLVYSLDSPLDVISSVLLNINALLWAVWAGMELSGWVRGE